MELALEVFGIFPDELLQRADQLPRGGSYELSELMSYYRNREADRKREEAQQKKKGRRGRR